MAGSKRVRDYRKTLQEGDPAATANAEGSPAKLGPERIP